MKFLLVTFVNGMSISFGPFPGSMHDARAAETVGINQLLDTHLNFGNGEKYTLLADLGFRQSHQILLPYK